MVWFTSGLSYMSSIVSVNSILPQLYLNLAIFKGESHTKHVTLVSLIFLYLLPHCVYLEQHFGSLVSLLRYMMHSVFCNF